MKSRVTPRARMRGDRSGDPLDGLVNLFDLGIVLAVAFLLAALQSVNLTDLLTRSNVTILRTEANQPDADRQTGRSDQDRPAEQEVGHRAGSAGRPGLPALGRAPVYVKGKTP